MFFLKDFFFDIKNNWSFYLLIFLSSIIFSLGVNFFLVLCDSFLKLNDGSFYIYIIVAIFFIILCSIDLGLINYYLIKSNFNRIQLYKTLGARNKTINLLIFFKGILFVLVSLAIGTLILYLVIPLFTTSLLNGEELNKLIYLYSFLINFILVFIVNVIVIKRFNKRYTLDKGFSENV